MSNVIEMPFGIGELDNVFKLMELLDNKKELIQEFKPEVSKYLVRKDFFKGPFRATYEAAFEELIVRLIKSQIIKHFPELNPEEIMLLTDKDFLYLLTDGYYFAQENYETKDGKNEQQTH